MNGWTIVITDWHDDFEPNTQAKQNRGSVWVHSITFLGPSESKNKAKYSYPIAFGNKSSNHDHILAMLRSEIDDINKSEEYFFIEV